MDPPPRPIVRRDFPVSADGYDRGTVDAHLEELAAALDSDRSAARRRTTVVDRELLAAGRLLLGQISSLRVELKNLSAWLREQSDAISEALEELLDLEEATRADVHAPEPAELAEPSPAELGDPAPPASAPAPAGSPEALEPPAATTPATPRAPILPPPPPPPPPPDSAAAATLADARLVALDMALGGCGRAEIDAALAERFDLADRTALVDEVLAALG